MGERGEKERERQRGCVNKGVFKMMLVGMMELEVEEEERASGYPYCQSFASVARMKDHQVMMKGLEEEEDEGKDYSFP